MASEIAGETGVATNCEVDSSHLTRRAFTVGLKEPIYSKDLEGHFDVIQALEFSDDGSLLVTGGDDGRILIWNTEQALDSTRQSAPTQLTLLYFSLFSLAISPDNSRIFAGGLGRDIFVFDTHA